MNKIKNMFKKIVEKIKSFFSRIKLKQKVKTMFKTLLQVLFVGLVVALVIAYPQVALVIIGLVILVGLGVILSALTASMILLILVTIDPEFIQRTQGLIKRQDAFESTV